IGAVFFLVDFDARGYVNRSWNVPLDHLLDNAGRGPDLGAGRIRLACRSQCSIPWHSRQLWDPVLEGEHNSLRQMMQALQRHRLGLTADVPDITDAVNVPPTLRSLAQAPVEQTPRAQTPRDRSPVEPPMEVPQSDRQLAGRVTQKLQQEFRTKLTALKEEQQLALAT